MTGAHLSAGTLTGAIAFLSTRYGWGVSQDEAAGWAATGLGVGAAVLHVLRLAYYGPGIWPAIKRTWKAPAAVSTIVALSILVAAVAATSASASVSIAAKITRATSTSTCHYRSWGALPDRSCTPGALNPAVTPATVASTICLAGWTSTIRPAMSVTEPQKIAAIAAYGSRFGTNLRAYEFDHLVPLELGGASDSPANLWPEPTATIGGAGSYDKDAVENHLNALVCDGKMKLAAAQHLFESDWRKGRPG